jgi:hypothetical protein
MAESTRNEDSAQGRVSEAETDGEQIEKPQAESEGTVQEERGRPTDLGKAREQSKNVSTVPRKFVSISGNRLSRL